MHSPETMPFINFDSQGICNYCKNYKLRNQPKPIENLERIISTYDLNKKIIVSSPFPVEEIVAMDYT